MRRAAYVAFVALLAATAVSSHTLELPYDGRFTFVRLRWSGGSTMSRAWSSAWNHDYPRAEQHLSQILDELTLVANFDNDVPEYWEWSGQGLFPFDASNEAYKLGVNYIIYGLTH